MLNDEVEAERLKKEDEERARVMRQLVTAVKTADVAAVQRLCNTLDVDQPVCPSVNDVPADVLHDAAGGIKRLLLSSANLSAAAWGRRRSHKFPNDENALPTDEGALEVRSFELGVSVPPADADRAKEDLPFVFPAAAAGQCQREFIGVNSLDRDDRGVMHY